MGIYQRFSSKFGIADYEKQTRNLALKLFDDARLSNEEAELLYFYTNFGIYGSNEGKAVLGFSDFSEKENSSSSVIGFMFKRLFPKRKEMECSYEYLKEKPYLIVFAYIHRLVTSLFKRDKQNKLANEIKTINEFKK